MHFEQSTEIDAPQKRIWDVLSDIEAWPQRIDTVELARLVTPAPLAAGSRVRLRQPKLPEGEWEITTWSPPGFFEWRQASGGMTVVAGHRVDALGEGRSSLTLTIDMTGLLAPIFGRLYSGLTRDYMAREAAGMKRAAESV